MQRSENATAALVVTHPPQPILPVSESSDRDLESFDALPLSGRMTIRARLRKREQIIKQCRDAWIAVATALMEIRDFRLYRAEGFTEFGRYCKERLHMGKSTVNRQIATGEVYKAVASTGANALPTSERQMRPLLALRQPNQTPEVWGKKVVEVWAKAVGDSEITKKPLTQKGVTRALHELGHDSKPKEAESPFDVQKRWTHLEDLLWHEREFWPVQHRRELSVRIVGLVSDWEAGKVQEPDGSSVTAIVVPDTTRNGTEASRLANTTNIAFESVEAEAVLVMLDNIGVCASSGSACTTGSLAPSHVLTAMGISPDRARGSLRFSLGVYNAAADVDFPVANLAGIISKLRAS